MKYLDIDLEIGTGEGGYYPVVVRSPAGEARERMHFPFDDLALESRLKDLEIALLRSGSRRRDVGSGEDRTVLAFGRSLFDALLTGEVRTRYDVSRQKAAEQGKGLRIRLRTEAAEIAAIPWEFLYDERDGEYLVLSRRTPLVRYIELPQPIEPLTIEPPLRVLGMIASPSDLAGLDVNRERTRLEEALSGLGRRGLVQLSWLDGQSWRDLQTAMRGGPWHVFHFIGHGGFDKARDEGFIALADDTGALERLPATQLARLLSNHTHLRLAFLNSCEGSRSGKNVFSSTASILVRRGIPAVLAMQYEITDRAAIEFARVYYESVADGMAVDAAVVEARAAVSVALSNSVEWGTPALHMRARDGVLFEITGEAAPLPPPAPAPQKRRWKRWLHAFWLSSPIPMALLLSLVRVRTTEAELDLKVSGLSFTLSSAHRIVARLPLSALGVTGLERLTLSAAGASGFPSGPHPIVKLAALNLTDNADLWVRRNPAAYAQFITKVGDPVVGAKHAVIDSIVAVVGGPPTEEMAQLVDSMFVLKADDSGRRELLHAFGVQDSAIEDLVRHFYGQFTIDPERRRLWEGDTGTIDLYLSAVPTGARVELARLEGLSGEYRIAFDSLAGKTSEMTASLIGPIRAILPSVRYNEVLDSVEGNLSLLPGDGRVNVDFSLATESSVSLDPQLPVANLRVYREELRERSDERDPEYVSTVLGGTIRFPVLNESIPDLDPNDFLVMSSSSGRIQTLTLQNDTILMMFKGEVGGLGLGVREQRRSLMPTSLEWLVRARRGLFLALALAIYAVGSAIGVPLWRRDS